MSGTKDNTHSMALPNNISTTNELKEALQHYVTNHAGITHFVFGKYAELAKTLQDVKKDEYTLFCPFPSVSPRDRSGSLDFRFISNIALFVPCKKNDFDSEEAALNTALSVLQQLIIRIRQDANDYGWSFTINDINQLDPVLDYSLNNAAGYQFPLYFGDFYSVKVDTNDWSDL